MGLLLLLLLAVAPTTYAGHSEYSGLIVFGDSLSDPGNAYAITGQEAVAPYDVVPSAAYAIGGHHFSNGKTYVEKLARSIHLNSSAKAAFDPELAKATNYAVGGARARTGTTSIDMTTQVGAFLSDVGGSAPADALYVIWLGGNDIRDALGAAFIDPTLATSFAILNDAVTTEAANIGALVASGATRFLILNAPNLGVVPAVTALGPGAVGAAVAFSAGYNDGLDTALDGLELFFPGIEITRFDAFSFLAAVVADGPAYGLPNTLMPCLTFGVIEDAVCDKPKSYLFWDGIHPTTATHGVLAAELETVLDGA